MSLLPPCQGSLRMYIMRSNYQALIWRHAHQATPSFPSPVGHGWDLTDGTTIEMVWIEGDLMSQEPADIVVDAPSQPPQVEDEEDQGELEFDNLLDIIFGAD